MVKVSDADWLLSEFPATSIALTCFVQCTKLISRLLGISKEAATSISFLVLFGLAILFTTGQQLEWLSAKQLAFLVAIIGGSIGNYELFLNKTGLDSVMKNLMNVERAKK